MTDLSATDRARSRLAELARPARAARTPPPRPARIACLALVAAALLLYPQLLTSPFWLETGILAMIFATAAAGWNVLGGYAGQVSFGNAVFFGAGAYTTAVAVRAGWSPWLGMLLGAAIAAVIGLAVGLPCFRLRSHYFAIATIAVGVIAQIIVTSNARLGASAGLTIPLRPESLATLQFSARDPTPYYYVALAIFAVAAAAVWLLIRAKPGLYFTAIRDDQDAAAAVGVNVWRYKLLAVAVSAVLTAVPGSFYAMYVLFVDPSLVLDLTVSINMVLMTMLGGLGTLWGPLIGAWALELLQQYTHQRYGSVAGLDLLIFGIVIVAVVVIEPGGIIALLVRAWNTAARMMPAARQRGSGDA